MKATHTIRIDKELVDRVKMQKLRYPFTPIAKFIEEAVKEKLEQAPTLKTRKTS